jgi:sulfur relay protein TusB/DsrH
VKVKTGCRNPDDEETRMLFVINKTRPNIFDLIQMLSGGEDKSVLLIGDAVNYANPFMAGKFQDLDVEEIYVARDALDARGITIAAACEIVGYDEMIVLILESDEKVLSI